MIFDGTLSGVYDVAFWIDENHGTVFADEAEDGTYYLSVQTLEGVMRANAGDYVIRGIQGEFYPVKPEIFHKTYEGVSDE